MISTAQRQTRAAYRHCLPLSGFSGGCCDDRDVSWSARLCHGLQVNGMCRLLATARLRDMLLFSTLTGDVAYCRCFLYDFYAGTARQPCYWIQDETLQAQ